MFAYFDRFNPTGFVDNWWMVDLYGINVGNITKTRVKLARDLTRPFCRSPKGKKKEGNSPWWNLGCWNIIYNLARYKLQPTTSTMDPMANVGKYTSPMDSWGVWQ